MMNIGNGLLSVALAFAFYHIGVDIVVEKEIYPGWLMLSREDFRRVRNQYEKSLFLFFYLPGLIEVIAITALLITQEFEFQSLLLCLSLVLLVANFASSYFFWAKWQQQVSEQDLPPGSKLVARIIRTNWIRTLVVILNGLVLLAANWIHGVG